MTVKAIRLDQQDNVATLLSDASKHQTVEVIDDQNQRVGSFQTLQAIPFGNKMALHAIAAEQPIRKAGYDIGRAIRAIPAGELVHVQNVRSSRVDIPDNIIEQIIQQMRIETE
ncbi:SAF domain-containing protein [Oceanimonas pelagia]|uniref:SAF domain-containing protein n=1 Tax=Oceanimonas pelagia TaxID=3028314 RepID=A0AA50KPR9_9GAMM|nr:SAF domain-containing protein [Oceanimonas pelagia]WMC11001.1 SAF domain-containing protein [Oceanimonas pelagia]